MGDAHRLTESVSSYQGGFSHELSHGPDAQTVLADGSLAPFMVVLEHQTRFTDGGRVLNVTALGETVAAAREKVYEAARKIHFSGAVYRTDIAAGV